MTTDDDKLRVALFAAANELRQAADDIANWGAYAGCYFQQKWNLPGDIKRVNDAADAAIKAAEDEK